MVQRVFAVLVIGWCWGFQQVAAHHTMDIEPLSVEDRVKYGIPKDNKILLNAKTTCEMPPLKQRASVALGCQTIEDGRECMKVEPDHIIFATSPSRSCHGKRCKMDLTPGLTTCMLRAYGVDVQLKNETRKATCGLDPAFSYWLKRFKTESHFETEVNCVTGLHSDIDIGYWSPCVNGAPRLHSELLFKEPFPGDYRCFFNPMCVNGTFSSHTVCYSLDSHGAMIAPDVEGKAAPQCKFNGLVFFLILLFYLRDDYF